MKTLFALVFAAALTVTILINTTGRDVKRLRKYNLKHPIPHPFKNLILDHK